MPTFNAVRGEVAAYAKLPAANDAIIAVLFQTAAQVTDDAMMDYATLAAIKAAQTEATFTNYTRKTLSGVVLAVDNTNNRRTADADDLQWAAAGGASNNTIGRVVFCYDPDTTQGAHDGTILPLTFYPYSTTTDGTTRTLQINNVGWWRSRELGT